MRAITAIILALFLPLAALMVVLSAPVCQALADATIVRSAAAPDEHDRLVQVALAVRDFSLGNDAADLPQGEDYRTAMTPDAIAHLLDVRTVFIAAEIAAAVLLISLVLVCVVAVRRHGARHLVRPLLIGGAVPLAAAALLGLVVALDFSAFFTWMHSLFFAAGTWTFPADSLLIRALPTDFWIGCAVVWAACMALFCLIALGVGMLLATRGRGGAATS
jgi:integral membrane protein (TIGR01906 family)